MRDRVPFVLRLYQLASNAAAKPFASWLLARRIKRGKENPARLGERYGHASLPRPAGRYLAAWRQRRRAARCRSA